MSASERSAVKRFAAYMMQNSNMSYLHAARWGINRMRRGLIPV